MTDTPRQTCWESEIWRRFLFPVPSPWLFWNEEKSLCILGKVLGWNQHTNCHTDNKHCEQYVVFVTCQFFANCVDNIMSIFHIVQAFISSIFLILYENTLYILIISYRNDQHLKKKFASTQFVKK